MTTAAPIDTSALTAPASRAEVAAFTKQLRAQGVVGRPWMAIGLGVIVAAAASIMAAAAIVGTVASRASGALLLPLIAVALAVGVGGLGTVLTLRRRAERRYRLHRFADANGMQWHPWVSDPALPGMIFGHGTERASRDVVRTRNPRPTEYANYRYTTGSGKSKQTHEWGYVAMRLDAPLPHIVLDATGNNGLFGASNLPMTFRRDQRLSLEGDFDEHFALYCPAGYERDALYLFTPDVMARFVDNAAALDVEIIDDYLFLYARRELSTLDPATWRWITSTTAAIDDKLAQWARWRDGHLAPPDAAMDATALTPPPVGVARQGRRLRSGLSWATIAAIVIGGGWLALSIWLTAIGR